MRVAVIGAGVIGVTTAYELGQDGHAVTVFDRHGSVAAEASFANAGLVAPGYVAPWAAPGMARKVLGHLGRAHAPVRIGGRLDAGTLAWMWRWWRATRPAIYARNRGRMHRLAELSRDRLHALTSRLHLDYEHANGFLVLLRSARDIELASPGIRTLQALGAKPELLDAAGCRAVEPGLSEETPLAGGVYSRDDEVGNCREFAHLLKREAERGGVRFRLGTAVSGIAGGSEPRVAVASGEEPFDAIVVCAGVGSRRLLGRIGVPVPILPVWGHSVTAPLREDATTLHREPRAALMDERYKVAISRIGRRVRVAGSAEIARTPSPSDERAQRTLDKVLDDWFPGITRRGEAQRWAGARPMLPDGPPVLGASGVDGVWLNIGHGGSGWALACGSAKLLADALAGRPNPIAIDGLGIERLRGGG
jgi:D-amino-acid dehydrogenase